MKIALQTILFLQLCVFQSIRAQEVENIRVELRDDLILVMYDLKATGSTADFKVEIFGSHNNFTSPIVQVSGDVGNSVKPGLNKIISWASKSELKNYQGELIFEIAATPNLSFSSMLQNTEQQPGANVPRKPVVQRPENYLNRLKSGKRSFNISLITGAAATGLGFYFKSSADKFYKQYQSATGQASNLRDKVELNDAMYPVAYAVGGAALLTSIYFALKLQKQKRDWGLTAVPVRSGVQIAWHHKF